MKKRSTEILQKIIRDSKGTYRMAELAKEYHVTERTLRNDVAEINHFLYSIHVPELPYEDGQLEIPPGFDNETVRRELYAMDAYLYKLSPEERQIYIEAALIQHGDYLPMQRLADALYVNRVTILNDVDNVRDALGTMGIGLSSDAGKGIRLDCSSSARIELLARVFRRIAINVENDGFFQRFVLKRLKMRHPFSAIVSILSEYTTANNLVFVDDTFYEIALYLFAFFHLHPLHAEESTELTEPTGLEAMMIYVGQQLGEPVTSKEVKEFHSYLRKENLSAFVKSIDEIELYKVIRFFLTEIDKDLHLNLHDDTVLIDSLLLHIKRLRNWGQVEIELPAAQESNIDYEQIEEAVREHAYILERFLSYELSPNMKASIVIHICVAIIRNHRVTSQLTVAVVCPGSMATGRYLEAQLKNYFDFHIVGVYPAADVLARLEAERTPDAPPVDLILSTVPLTTDKYRVLKVHPFLSMEDMNRIQQLSFACQKPVMAAPTRVAPEEAFLQELRDVMERYQVSLALRHELEQVVQSYEHRQETKRRSAISELLRYEFLTEDAANLDWQTAMRHAAAPLEKAGCVEPAYIEKAIEHVKEYGDYIVVSRGIALAHANKDYGVHQDALSLFVSRPGITCSDGETKVHLIFCFASKGEKDYIDLLKEVVSIGQKEGLLEKLLTLPLAEIFETLAYEL